MTERQTPVWQCRLRKRRYLYRTVDVSNGAAKHVITCNGRRDFYVSVTIDDLRITKKCVLWRVTKFDFQLGDSPGRMEVRVHPWDALKSIHMFIDGELAYLEEAPGFSDYKNLRAELRLVKKRIRVNVIKILLGAVLASIVSSLLIGSVCWLLSGAFDLKYYLRVLPVGIIYFLLMLLIHTQGGLSRSPKLSEIGLMESKHNKLDRIMIKYWPVAAAPFNLGFIYLILTTYQGRVEYLGYWVGMLFFLGMVILLNVILYYAARNTKRGALQKAHERKQDAQ